MRSRCKRRRALLRATLFVGHVRFVVRGCVGYACIIHSGHTRQLRAFSLLCLAALHRLLLAARIHRRRRLGQRHRRQCGVCGGGVGHGRQASGVLGECRRGRDHRRRRCHRAEEASVARLHNLRRQAESIGLIVARLVEAGRVDRVARYRVRPHARANLAVHALAARVAFLAVAAVGCRQQVVRGQLPHRQPAALPAARLAAEGAGFHASLMWQGVRLRLLRRDLQIPILDRLVGLNFQPHGFLRRLRRRRCWPIVAL
mmetsp:Transcript_37081/g.78103  ORF Transcript_37081/g.78103 Transcript_37081/m.78103 type:complete len:258 (-) Transcript_37081:681-1454(-)